MNGDLDERIRQAAQAVLDGGGRDAYRALVEVAFEPIERAVRKVARKLGSASGDEAGSALFKKLDQGSFLRQLTQATSPAGFLSESVRNAAVDQIRARGERARDVALQAVPEEDLCGPGPDLQPDPEDLALMRSALDRLATEDRVVMRVVHVGKAPLPKSDVQWIARQRGVPEERVAAELRARAAREEEHERGACEDVEQRAERLAVLLQRIAVRLRLLGERATHPAPLSPERREQLWKPDAFQRATPEERTAYVDWMEQERERQAAALAEARAKVGTGSPAYDEVAIILGLLDPAADAATRKRVVNTLTRRVHRIRSRLQEELRALAGQGGGR